MLPDTGVALLGLCKRSKSLWAYNCPARHGHQENAHECSACRQTVAWVEMVSAVAQLLRSCTAASSTFVRGSLAGGETVQSLDQTHLSVLNPASSVPKIDRQLKAVRAVLHAPLWSDAGSQLMQ